jgi:hypothetical protein
MTTGGYQDECNWLLVLNTEDVLAGQASWQVPPQSGAAPKPRGYHAACIVRIRGNTANPTSAMIVVGGMCRGRPLFDLAMIDVTSWQWLPVPVFASREAPCARYGCSMCPFSLASSSAMNFRYNAVFELIWF